MISIALAAYNGEKYIREQIDSILAQTYQDFELVICDDCSTDSTWGIIQEYEQRDGRIHGYRNDANLGFKKNFEKAIGLCRGEYVALSDQDDVWTRDHLEVLFNAITNNKCSLVCSDYYRMTADGNVIEAGNTDCGNKTLSSCNNTGHIFILAFNNIAQGNTILFKKHWRLKYCLYQKKYYIMIFGRGWWLLYMMEYFTVIKKRCFGVSMIVMHIINLISDECKIIYEK